MENIFSKHVDISKQLKKLNKEIDKLRKEILDLESQSEDYIPEQRYKDWI